MSATITQRDHPPTQPTQPTDRAIAHRPHHLTHLAAAIRAYGGTAVVSLSHSLSHTAHPVLYVRYQDRTIPVVLIQEIGRAHV